MRNNLVHPRLQYAPIGALANISPNPPVLQSGSITIAMAGCKGCSGACSRAAEPKLRCCTTTCATKCEMAFVGAGRYPCDGHCGDHLHFFPGATENAQARSLLSLSTDSRLVHLNSCFWQGRAGVPMEVMGLMVGEFVDDYMVVVSSILPLATWC